MDFLDEVVKPSLKEVSELPYFPRLCGLVLLTVVLPVFYIAYHVAELFGRDF